MKIKEQVEFTISQHFACLIEYGNEGGYTEEEEVQVDSFLQRLTKMVYEVGATHSVISYGEDVVQSPFHSLSKENLNELFDVCYLCSDWYCTVE